MKYRGRFAPSPTGPLHFGSLVAAAGSYLDARHQRGEWLLRIEDLDPPREVAGAGDAILRALELLGLSWDGAVSYQSQRNELYQEALDRLDQSGYLYHCGCSRKEIADSAIVTAAGPVYPGTCRNGLPPGKSARSIRVRTQPLKLTIQDRLQTHIGWQLQTDIGDFIVRRADQLFSYQLAVVVDDADQHISHVVRGVDLLDSTPRQMYLQRLLELPSPEYLHLPVAINAANDKLSKQTSARPIDTHKALETVINTLRFLQQPLPESPCDASLDELWRWAVEHWDVSALPAQRAIPAPQAYIDPA